MPRPADRWSAGNTRFEAEGRSGQDGVAAGPGRSGFLQGRQGGLQRFAVQPPTSGLAFRFALCGGRSRTGCRFDDQFGRIQPDGSGRVEQFRGGEPQLGAPHRGIDDETRACRRRSWPAAHARPAKAAGGGATVGPARPATGRDGSGSPARLGQQRIERGCAESRGGWRLGLGIRHRTYDLSSHRKQIRSAQLAHLGSAGRIAAARRRPAARRSALLLGVGAGDRRRRRPRRQRRCFAGTGRQPGSAARGSPAAMPSARSTRWPPAWANCRPRPTASTRSASA